MADHIVMAFADNVTHVRLMAYAVDLPLRESRVGAFLDGRRSSGLVTADADDVAIARAALVRVQATTVTLYVGSGGRKPTVDAVNLVPDTSRARHSPGDSPVAVAAWNRHAGITGVVRR